MTTATAAGSPGGRARGSRHGRARLTEEEVTELRQLAGTVRPKDIAARYGISRVTVLDIIARRTWTHLPEEQRS